MKVFLKSKEVKKRLILKNKSQNWLANRLEISSGYISQLMDGSRNPSPRLRRKILSTFPKSKFYDLFEIKDTGK